MTTFLLIALSFLIGANLGGFAGYVLAKLSLTR